MRSRITPAQIKEPFKQTDVSEALAHIDADIKILAELPPEWVVLP
nr:hypothetical protein [Enterovibrio nigricans]